MDRLASGAISQGGRVGACSSPHLVMPPTMEPSKPRLCNNNHFCSIYGLKNGLSPMIVFNIYPSTLEKDFYQTGCDDKFGYDHILVSPNSGTYFSFE